MKYDKKLIPLGVNKEFRLVSKNWFDWCWANRHKNSTGLTSLVFWLNYKVNELNYPKSFKIIGSEAMHVLGIGSYTTYNKLLNTLSEIGYIKLVVIDGVKFIKLR